MRLCIESVQARLRAPFVSSQGSVAVCPLLLVRLEASDGAVGFGEAAALGIGVDSVRAAIEDCRDALTQSEGHEHEQLRAQCAQLAVLAPAIAAIDLALWDLNARRAGEPVWRLLGAAHAREVELNATIAAPDRAGAAGEAARARDAGFRCVKVKVGVGDDAGRLAAVRAVAGAQMAIRVDANGVWSEAEAIAALGTLAPVGLELCEEPVSGLDAIELVAEQSAVPLAIDESAARPGALERRVCDYVCLKIARCGGISGMIDAARKAREAGYEVYLASMLDGPLGISAALHAAAAVVPELPCGLATLDLFADRPDVLPVSAGRLRPPGGPGLGEGLVDWYGAS